MNPRLSMIFMICVAILQGMAMADVDQTFEPGQWPKASGQWEPAPAEAWAVQSSRGEHYLQNTGGGGATLTRKLDLSVPMTFAVDYGWKFGEGAASFELVLQNDAGETRGVSVQQSGDDGKYRVLSADGDVVAQAAGEKERGAAAGGSNHTGTLVVTLHEDGQLTFGPLRGEASHADVGAFVPTHLVIRDTSPNNEGLRLSRLRVFSGVTEPTVAAGTLRMPIGGLFIQGESPKLWLEPTWIGGDARELTASVSVSPVAHEATPVKFDVTDTVSSGDRLVFPTDDLAALPVGLYEVEANVDGQTIHGRFAVASKELFAVPREQIPGWVGLVPYMNVMPRDTYGETFAFMDRLGVKHVRWLPGWGRLEPERDQYDWSETDQFMDLCDQHGITAMFCLSYYGAKWTGPASHGQMAKTDQGRELWVEHFAKPTMQRYGDRVKQWQIWNEPDAFWNDDPAKVTGFARGFGSASNYFDLLKRTHAAAQELEYDDLRVMASLSSADQNGSTQLLFKYGLGDIFDGLIIHTYGNHLRHLLEADKLLTKLGKPDAYLGSGETGIPTGESLRDELRQANKVIEVFLQSAVADSQISGQLMGIDWFVMHDLIANARFGLLDKDLQPQPAVLAYFTVARLLAGAGEASTQNWGDVRVYRVARDGRSPITAIVAGGGTSSVSLRVAGDAAPIAWDWSGQKHELSVDPETHLATLDIGDVMVLVEGDIEVRPPTLASVTPMFLADGSPAVRVSIDGDASNASAELSVAALGLKETQPLSADKPAVFKVPVAEQAEVYDADVTLETSDGTTALETSIEFTPVTPVTADEAASLTAPARLPGFALSGEENYTLFKGEYNGPQDNSARLAFGYTDEALVVWIDQIDDVFTAPPARAPWSADGPQLAIDPAHERTPSSSLVEFAFGISRDEGVVAFVPGQPHYHADLLAERDEATRHTRYRLSIPLSQLQIPDAPDGQRVIGFSMILNDSDGQGRKGWLGWGAGIGTEKNPAKYRTLILVEPTNHSGDGAATP